MKWTSKELSRQSLAAGHMSALDGEVGYYEKGEDDERSSSHGPTIADTSYEVAEHNGKDHAPQTRAGSEESEGGAPAFFEPAADASNGG